MKKYLILAAILLFGLISVTVPVSAQSGNSIDDAISAVRPDLAIKVSPTGFTGEKIPIKVLEANGSEPVAEAGIWAVDIKNSGNLSSISANPEDNGEFLGWTDKQGVLVHIFQAPGTYLLVAFKDGYFPGFAWTQIQPLKEMAIKGPEASYVYQKCEFFVYEPDTGAGVAGAAIYAWNQDTDTPTTTNDMVTQIISTGIFLGNTDRYGKLNYAFNKSGKYLLLAVKRGYKPAFSKIIIKDLKQMTVEGPESAYTGQTCEFSVKDVESGAGLAGAAVWALPISTDAELSSEDQAAVDRITAHGIFLGYTTNTGNVYHAFEKAEKYVILAIKMEYKPAFTRILIKELKEMALSNPDSALVGQTCEFQVYEPETGKAVEGAAVWALNENSTNASTGNNLVTHITATGILLGYTDNDGKVYYAFEEAGKYLLLAVKKEYKPAFGKIKIEEVKELAIRNPSLVRVMAQVPIRVVDKSVLPVENPVAGASVWAIQSDKRDDLDVSDLALFVKSNGIFLGTTDNTGYVNPRPRFSQPGHYWLIAIKDGYAPGISEITVISMATPTPVTKAATKSAAINSAAITKK